jgi:hypothetical protein
MTIGVLKIELSLFNARSLKQKRITLKSLKDRLRRSFNVSVAETDNHNKWQRASLSVVSVGTDNRMINSILSKVVELVKNTHSVELLNYNMELL